MLCTLYPGVLAAHIAILNFGHFIRQKKEQGAPSVLINNTLTLMFYLIVVNAWGIKLHNCYTHLVGGTLIGFQKFSVIP